MHIVSFIQPAHSYVAFVLLWSQFSTRFFQSSHVFYLNFHSSHANGYFEKFWTNESHNSYMIPIFFLPVQSIILPVWDGWMGGGGGMLGDIIFLNSCNVCLFMYFSVVLWY